MATMTANPTPTTALRDVIEALAMAKDGPYFASSIDGTTCVHRALDTHGGAGVMVDGETWTLPDAIAMAAAVNFIRDHADTLRRALAVMEAVEAAPVGHCEYAGGALMAVHCHAESLDGQRVALVRVGEG
jgi:hypothetical protein